MGIPVVGPVLKTVFGTRNERMVKRYLRVVERVSAHENDVRVLTDQELRATAEEVHLEREDGHAFFAGPVGELSDLPAVGEQGSNPSGVVLERAGGGIFSDVNAMQRQHGRDLGGSDISLG